MNKTVLTMVQTDSGGNDAKFTVTGERNGLIFFEEDFVYDGKVLPLRLHLEKEKFMKELTKKAEKGEMYAFYFVNSFGEELFEKLQAFNSSFFLPFV